MQVQADCGEEQRKRHGEGDDDRAPSIPKKEKQDNDDQQDAFCEIVKHGVGGVVEQFAAIQKRDNLNSGRKDVDC